MKPSELFDVSGRSALITGASGAFGAVAARTLAEAGCRLTLAAGNSDALEAVAGECRDLGAAVAAVNARPDSEAAVDAMVEKPWRLMADSTFWSWRRASTGQR